MGGIMPNRKLLNVLIDMAAQGRNLHNLFSVIPALQTAECLFNFSYRKGPETFLVKSQ